MNLLKAITEFLHEKGFKVLYEPNWRAYQKTDCIKGFNSSNKLIFRVVKTDDNILQLWSPTNTSVTIDGMITFVWKCYNVSNVHEPDSLDQLVQMIEDHENNFL